MKICDRCRNPENPAVIMFRDVKDGTEYDLCQECKDEFLKFLTPLIPEIVVDEDTKAISSQIDINPKRGRPRKDGSN